MYDIKWASLLFIMAASISELTDLEFFLCVKTKIIRRLTLNNRFKLNLTWNSELYLLSRIWGSRDGG
jgi:hypothetical protein